jgi:hypothetical protein
LSFAVGDPRGLMLPEFDIVPFAIVALKESTVIIVFWPP